MSLNGITPCTYHVYYLKLNKNENGISLIKMWKYCNRWYKYYICLKCIHLKIIKLYIICKPC